MILRTPTSRFIYFSFTLLLLLQVFAATRAADLTDRKIDDEDLEGLDELLALDEEEEKEGHDGTNVRSSEAEILAKAQRIVLELSNENRIRVIDQNEYVSKFSQKEELSSMDRQNCGSIEVISQEFSRNGHGSHWETSSTYSFMVKKEEERDLGYFLVFPFLLFRLLHDQLWISFSRYRTAKGTNRIVDKGIDFEQVDREANWDDQILMNGLLFYIALSTLSQASCLPFWRKDGFVLTFLLHVGPVEFLYYWLHRALHHHFLYSRYHSHHSHNASKSNLCIRTSVSPIEIARMSMKKPKT